MQEDVRVDEAGTVVLPPGLKRGANVRPTGEDIAKGQVVLTGGPSPAAAGYRAGGGARPDRGRGPPAHQVAVFSTGDEIVAPGRRARTGPALRFEPLHADGDAAPASAARSTISASCATTPRRSRPCSKTAVASHDLILTSGGVSTGEADYVKAAVESVGKLVFWRMAIKPGRPVAMGVIGGTPFIGLPGNPVASFVTFAYLARPAILALSGTPHAVLPPRPFCARSLHLPQKAGRREYVRVSLRRAADGVFEAVKFPARARGFCPRWWKPTASSSCASRPAASSPARALPSWPIRAWSDETAHWERE